MAKQRRTSSCAEPVEIAQRLARAKAGLDLAEMAAGDERVAYRIVAKALATDSAVLSVDAICCVLSGRRFGGTNRLLVAAESPHTVDR